MEVKQNDVFDYLEWRGDLSFEQSGFNEVDGLILSILAYLDFSCADSLEQTVFQTVIQKINRLPDEIKYNGPTKEIMQLVMKLGNRVSYTARFSGMKITCFRNITDEETEIQFAAVTFILPDHTYFVAFRGTDNTLVGWKEDFNMCFTHGIPSQLEATRYVFDIAKQSELPLRLGGHSKGGNLAIWAAAHIEENYQKRIINVYSNDAPGFNDEFFHNPSYLNIRHKILSFVPESSIVGVLMNHDKYVTILSSNHSVLQHHPFSWLVLGTHFIYDKARTVSGQTMERVINAWLSAMSVEEREELVDNIYDILTSSNARTLNDLDRQKLKAFLMMQKTFKNMEMKKQKQLLISLSKLVFNEDILPGSSLLNLLTDKIM